MALGGTVGHQTVKSNRPQAPLHGNLQKKSYKPYKISHSFWRRPYFSENLEHSRDRRRSNQIPRHSLVFDIRIISFSEQPPPPPPRKKTGALRRITALKSTVSGVGTHTPNCVSAGTQKAPNYKVEYFTNSDCQIQSSKEQ